VQGQPPLVTGRNRKGRNDDEQEKTVNNDVCEFFLRVLWYRERCNCNINGTFTRPNRLELCGPPIILFVADSRSLHTHIDTNQIATNTRAQKAIDRTMIVVGLRFLKQKRTRDSLRDDRSTCLFQNEERLRLLLFL
jgi:hypothetical protein